jgi:hypothetical protein
MPKRRENSREVFAMLFRIAFTHFAVCNGALRKKGLRDEGGGTAHSTPENA